MKSLGAIVLCMGLCLWATAQAVSTSSSTGTALASADLESVLQSLRDAGMTSSATVLQTAVATGGISLPPGDFTVFAPTNGAVDAVVSSSYPSLNATLAYHIAPRGLFFDELVSLPAGTQIPTLLPGNTLLVTDNDPVKFLIVDQLVLASDLCTVPTVACHAVDGVLNSTAWGHTVSLVSASPPLEAPAPVLVGSLLGSGPLSSPLSSPASPPAEAPAPPVPEPESGLSPLGLTPLGTTTGAGTQPSSGSQLVGYYIAAQSLAVAAAVAAMVRIFM